MVSSTRSGTVDSVHSGSLAMIRRIDRRSAARLFVGKLEGERSRSICLADCLSSIGLGDLTGDCSLEPDDDADKPCSCFLVAPDCIDNMLTDVRCQQQQTLVQCKTCKEQTFEHS